VTTAVIPIAYDYGTSIPGVMGETMSDKDSTFCFLCPVCESRIASRQELVGARMMCPECNEIIYVPFRTAPLESGAGNLEKTAQGASSGAGNGPGSGEEACDGKPAKGELSFLEMVVAGILLLLFLEFIGC
jgi:hypothetical protein